MCDASCAQSLIHPCRETARSVPPSRDWPWTPNALKIRNMRHPKKSITTAIKHYLQTGDHDAECRNWPGTDFLDCARKADSTLRDALLAAVRARGVKAQDRPGLPLDDVVSITRDKVAPMVTGLFPLAERRAVMATLETSVVFLTPDNIESVLRSCSWLRTTWSLANMYLVSYGAEPLSPEAQAIVGLSQETTCYLSVDYLADQEQDPCADYLVHEASHVFHNCKRQSVGLTQTRSREFLLNIDYSKRETFAYACEAYSRILTLGDTQAKRIDALQAHARKSAPDASVDQSEYIDILGEAVSARNGWKRILQRCAPGKRRQ